MNTNDFSLPIDFTNRMKLMLADESDAFFKSYQENNFHGLRINILKASMNEGSYANLLDFLGLSEDSQIPWAKDGFYYPESLRPGKHPFHEMGLYYIQEPSAMSAAALLAPSPGDRVLDLCAAPGGKSTQLASYLKQEGLLISNEINPARSKILAQNVERMGLCNTVVTNEDSDTLADHYPEFFHKILVDAPCSGEGMFRKNHDAMDEWSPEQVQVCAKRQLMILNNAARMLQHKGLLVYSTCTFAPEENEQVIHNFLLEHPDFILVHKDVPYFDAGNPAWAVDNLSSDMNFCEKQTSSSFDLQSLRMTYRLWPHHLNGEGHYAAMLFKGTMEEYQEYTSLHHTTSERASLLSPIELLPDTQAEQASDRISDKKKSKKAPSWGDKTQQQLLEDFLSCNLSPEFASFLYKGKLVLFKDELYRLPEMCPSLSGIKTNRAGLHIGTFKKNRFEPAHALALFLGSNQVNNTISLTYPDARIDSYFRGESIPVEAANGWCLLCINGFSAGWGKVNQGILKNHYPKGLRIQSFEIS